MMKKRRKDNVRKTPHKHIVRTKHPRYKVKSYDRGSGDKPSRKKRVPRRIKERKPVSKKTIGDLFEVRIEYTDRSFEHVDVTSPNYTGALDSGIETRKKLKAPAIIRMRRRG